MGVADNEYIAVSTNETPINQPPTSYYPQQQQFVVSLPTPILNNGESSSSVVATVSAEVPICCDRCDLEAKAKVQRFSIVGPWLFQVIFLFFGIEPFFYFCIAPLIGLLAMYTQKRWVVVCHFITALVYYTFSILFLFSQNQSNSILLSILFSLIFALSLSNYIRYIRVLGKLSKAGECLQSTLSVVGNGFDIKIEQVQVQQQPQQTIQPMYFAPAPIQQQQQVQPQIVYDANHQPLYHLIPIQNNNHN